MGCQSLFPLAKAICHSLTLFEFFGGPRVNIIGIVAEYNPFHTGHGYQMAESRAQLG